MKIAQLVHTLTYGDAISNEAISIKKILGNDCKIYSLNAHALVKKYTEPADAQKISTSDVVFLHYSIGSPLNQIYKELKTARKIFLYHNLTPVKWFKSYNYRVAKDLEQGVSELPELLKCSDVVLADSSFNKSELVDLGRADVEVFPLLFDQSKWSVDANPGIAANLANNGLTNILTVGRLAPNKCVEDIIKAFYFYHHKINKKSALWLIGHDIDTEIYSFELRNLVRHLNLAEAVNFVGSVADSELKAFYQNCALYLCMSEHEGFCVPVLEAMSLKLPVLAYDSSALSETLADGGVLIKHKRHAEVAEAMNVLIEDRELRSALIQKGSIQAEKFSQAAFSKRLESIVSCSK
jgi:glycosyltransferase involved in cell wall biosynthesis